MKKLIISALAIVAMTTSGCMMGPGTGTGTGTGGGLGDVLGSVLGGVLSNGSATNGLLNMVIGYVKIDERELYGTWAYQAPGCAFTSENLLAKAGGAVAAENVKQKLAPAYNTVGINANNTFFVFSQDQRFQAKVAGIPLSGTYTYDKTNCAIKFNTGLVSATGYLTRTTSGMALTFESKKLLTILQVASAMSGNETLKTVGDLSKEFDGLRVGFDMRK